MAPTRPEALSRFGAEEPAVPRARETFRPFSWSRPWLRPLLTTPIWSRLLLLFLALAAIKLALVLRLGKHLFEIHWRVEETKVEAIDYLSFGFFVLIGSLTLARLARHCRGTGVASKT